MALLERGSSRDEPAPGFGGGLADRRGDRDAGYTHLLGVEPAIDFSDQADDPSARQDPNRFFGGCTFALGDQLLGLRPTAPPGDRFDPTRIGLDHLSLAVDSPAALQKAADRLTTAGVEHGEVTELDEIGMAILSVQDPDDINLELVALLPSAAGDDDG